MYIVFEDELASSIGDDGVEISISVFVPQVHRDGVNTGNVGMLGEHPGAVIEEDGVGGAVQDIVACEVAANDIIRRDADVTEEEALNRQVNVEVAVSVEVTESQVFDESASGCAG